MIQKQQTAPDETAYSLLQLHLKTKVIFNPPYVLTINIALYNIFPAEKANIFCPQIMPDMFCCGFYVAIPSRGPVRVNMISYEVVWSYNFWFVTSKPTVWRPFWLNMLILFDFPLKKNVLRSENCHMIPNDHMNACGEGYRYLASMYNTKTTVLTLLGASLAHFILIFGWLDPLFWP